MWASSSLSFLLTAMRSQGLPACLASSSRPVQQFVHQVGVDEGRVLAVEGEEHAALRGRPLTVLNAQIVLCLQGFQGEAARRLRPVGTAGSCEGA